ncbi:MAG: HAD family hydrolase [Elusimicrobiota bacterium]|jgi:D-glycero-D-manno-heptose 1,7-bisphosphate phosphatase|nr:HAD family hydrolase [Elusimicrobiota bacterium]
MNKAVLLDRDGTVIKEKPGVYLASPRGVKLYKNTLKALALFKKAGFKIFIVSNQSGVGRGYFGKAEVEAVNAKMLRLLSKAAKVQAVYYCPHAPDTPCGCRKPAPQMGLDIIKKYKIDAARSFVVGDKKSDIDFSRNIGMQSVLVLTGNGRAQQKKYGKNLGAGKVCADIYYAAKHIGKVLCKNI